eukprot:TRINITY_DN61614_c0_g1_i1.p1 TRINITY_DN61614_c0_g1~~TRINITY_DN61614_c0_g1_i1.p1  ORF type:complete len:912 (+),score=131.61 TRINITY_DN61614_c0_g1_i1:93-2738(+)
MGVFGRAFNDTASYYNRLPAAAERVVRRPIWDLQQDSAGMFAQFVTDAKEIYLNYTLHSRSLDMWHFPSTGVSGFDLYIWDPKHNKFRWVATNRPTYPGNAVKLISHSKNERIICRLHLPLYNAPKDLWVGYEHGSFLKIDAHYKPGPPIVWYGTSILQGAVASRPGQAMTNIIAREMGLEILNFGFSGNCLMEISVVEWLVKIANPRLFVIDCSWNMSPDMIRNRTVPLVKYYRKYHPTTPIILAEGTPAGEYWWNKDVKKYVNEKRMYLRDGYNQLVHEGYKKLHYVHSADLYNNLESLIDPTVGGTHPSDLGQQWSAAFYLKYLPTIINTKTRGLPHLSQEDQSLERQLIAEKQGEYQAKPAVDYTKQDDQLEQQIVAEKRPTWSQQAIPVVDYAEQDKKLEQQLIAEKRPTWTHKAKPAVDYTKQDDQLEQQIIAEKRPTWSQQAKPDYADYAAEDEDLEQQIIAEKRPNGKVRTLSLSAQDQLLENELIAGMRPNSHRVGRTVGGGHNQGTPPSDLKWMDMKKLDVRGRAFADTAKGHFFSRLPAAANGVVRKPVWELSEDATGMYIRFTTDSSLIAINATLMRPAEPLWHMPWVATSGFDLYAWDPATSHWRHVDSACGGQKETAQYYNIAGGLPTVMTTYLLYLPLRNSIADDAWIGVEANAYIGTDAEMDAAPKLNSSAVLWYGTSIQQGGVASRGGHEYDAFLSRNISREILNFGFAGNGKMEINVAEFLVKVKQPISVFIVDCLPNLNAQEVTNRTGPLVKYIRKYIPNSIPLVLVENTPYPSEWYDLFRNQSRAEKNQALRTQYLKLVREGYGKNLHYVTGDQLFAAAGTITDPLVNPTVGGTHPSDLGQWAMSTFWSGWLNDLLHGPRL